MAVFLDANIFLYAAGGDSPHRAPSIAVLRAVAEERLEGLTSTEVLQEILHVVTRRQGVVAACTAVQHVMGLVPLVLAVERADIIKASELLTLYPQVSVRDAVHAATAIRAGIYDVVSVDRHFDVIAGVRRIDPGDADAVQALM